MDEEGVGGDFGVAILAEFRCVFPVFLFHLGHSQMTPLVSV